MKTCSSSNSSGNISLVPMHDESDNDSISLSTGAASPLEASPLTETTTAPTTSLSPAPDINEPFHDVTCTICLEDYIEGEQLVVLPCKHAFHSDCIVPWLTERSPTCPLCKALMEVEREGDELHRRQREEERRNDEQQDVSSTIASGDGEEGDEQQGVSSTIISGDGEEDDVQNDQEPQTNNILTSLRSWYNDSNTSRRPRQEEEDIETATTQENEPEVTQSGRRSVMGTSSWRVIFERSSRRGFARNDEESHAEEVSQNRMTEMQQPLLNNEGNDASTIVV